MATKRACCVPGCLDTTSKRHRFPKNDEALFQLWARNINHPRFKALTRHQIYRSYFVCNSHFVEKFIVAGTRRGLRKDAVPTVLLQNNENDGNEPMPSTSRGISDKTVITEYSKSRFCANELLEQEPEDNIIITNKSTEARICVPILQEQESEVAQYPINDNIESSTNQTKKGILCSINVTREKYLTPRCKKLYRKAVE